MPSGRIDHQGHSDMEFGALKAEKGWKGTGMKGGKPMYKGKGKGFKGKGMFTYKGKGKGVKEYKGEGKGKRNERNERQRTRPSMLSLW